MIHPDLATALPFQSVRTIRFSEVSAELEIEWNRLRQSNPIFHSPYFDIEFVRAVDHIRSDVEIALLESHAGELVGIFPFQRVGRGVAEPVGGRLNDLHGLLGLPSNAKAYEQILSACQIRTFKFHSIAENETDISRFEFCKSPSYFIDLSDGFDSYLKWGRKNSTNIRRQPQKTRGLERDFKNVHFEFDCTDSIAMEQLIRYKRERYQRSKTFDILGVTWASNLLREIHRVSSHGFQGILSIIWSGDEFVAGHFGMISKDVLHYWFPVFNPAFKKYSPGTELILRVAETAANLGLTKVDFGYGDDPFKRKVCNGKEQVSCGEVRFSRAAFEVSKYKFRLRNQLKKIPMKAKVKSLLRVVYPGFGQWNFK